MRVAHRQRRSPWGLFSDQPRPRLYDHIVEVLRVYHYGRRTEQASIHWIRRFIEFHGHQHPRQLAEENANRFLTHLAVEGRAASTFRHSFATHLIEAGYDIRTVQELFGRNDVETPMLHTHVLNRGGRGVQSPVDFDAFHSK